MFWTTRSFILMNIAARLTGSISVSAPLYRRSNSSLCQRVVLRPENLFSLVATSHDGKTRMDGCGSTSNCQAYIWRSAVKWPRLSGLASSEPKKTDATTVFSSISIPALLAPCLMMACSFCRSGLIEVWSRSFRRFPSLARMPSAPRFHPAWSRTALALSTLNSHRVFLDWKRLGALT